MVAGEGIRLKIKEIWALLCVHVWPPSSHFPQLPVFYSQAIWQRASCVAAQIIINQENVTEIFERTQEPYVLLLQFGFHGSFTS